MDYGVLHAEHFNAKKNRLTFTKFLNNNWGDANYLTIVLMEKARFSYKPNSKRIKSSKHTFIRSQNPSIRNKIKRF